VASVDRAQPIRTDESALIRQAQRGDPEARAALVERYWTRVYRWLYRLTRDQHVAEDLVQEAFLKAIAHLDRFAAGTSFSAWLFRIAHNHYANHCRSVRSSQPLPDDLPAAVPEPTQYAEARESLAGVAAALDRLPNELRAALLLRAEHDLSFHEIAQALGLTEETARWRVYKARKMLLSWLEARQEQERP
jgi:RNA polymerase sigma-70 factor (ECF subfamily)